MCINIFIIMQILKFYRNFMLLYVYFYIKKLFAIIYKGQPVLIMANFIQKTSTEKIYFNLLRAVFYYSFI